MIATIIILLLALQVFLSMVESKVRDAFNDPTWLKLEEEKPFDFNFDMKSFYAQLDVENSEYNYGHEVGKYHSDD